MTREHAEELLPIITAFANGEEVQLNIGSLTKPLWETKYNLDFSGKPDQYRIKPKPREFVLFRPAGCSDHIATAATEWGMRQPEAIKVREILD